ncbi:translation machinery-associated protein 16 homolog [Neodiprion lecontei]|uniref:Translation machinery-associated protein 16 homolog n=1 Tax=Neodiprion lecontei TaxID=441921 RepID=A0A6J0BEU1_NEOLC|nr:translation machinery-associated protein 16 homolog [Neodiprion lecontei]
MSMSMKKVLASAKKVMHPNSRKSIAITKKTKRITNREKLKLGNAMKQNLIGEKMLWIQENMLPDVCPYTPQLADELVKKYMARNDEELEQISIKHSIGGRKNRQHASREDILRMTKKNEEAEYDTCGIEIPDIFNPAQCEMLRKWDGELRYLPNFKFTRFGKNHLLKAMRHSVKPAKKSVTKSGDETLDKLMAETHGKDSTDNKVTSNRRGTSDAHSEKDKPCFMEVE